MTAAPALLAARAKAQPNAVALRVKELGLWREYTWADYAAEVDRIARGLHHRGVREGDRVVIVSDNRPEWLFCDLAVDRLGGVTVALHPSATDIASALATATVVIAGDEEQVDKLDGYRGPVVVIDPRGVQLTQTMATLASLDGDPLPAMPYDQSEVHPAEIAVGLGPGDEVLSVVPLGVPTEHALSVLGALDCGYVVNFGDPGGDPNADLRDVQPTVVLGVNAMWEAFHQGTETRAANASRLKRTMFGWAMGQGERLAPKRAASRLGPLDRLVSGLAWLVIHRPVRQKLGLGRARVLLCEGPPLTPATAEWFAALGVPVQAVA